MRSIAPPAALLMLILASPAAAATGAATVSPGEVDRAAPVASPCPAFSWAAVDGAEGYEVAVVDEARADDPQLVLRHRVTGPAYSWTPAGDRCLAPGASYAWTVRALDAAGQPIGADGGWAELRRFSVPALPSAEEVTAALETLRRWQTGSSTEPAREQATPRNERGPADKAVEVSGAAAIRGENPAASGDQHGVWGQTSSAAGAGLVAANLAVGPDLILDGAAAGVPDARITEKRLDRPSASAQSFSFENSLGGGMTVNVNGVAVSLTGHLHSGADIASGTVADGRIAATLARDAEVLGLVLAGDGPGSTLDADLLDGLQGASYQRRVTGTCPPGQAILGVNADGSVECSAGGGGSPTVSVLDSTAGVGDGSSIAIGLDGFPVVSYVNATADTLKIAKCNDPACAGGDETINTIDPSGDVNAWYTSIAVPADGRPVVCYNDSTARSLRVAKCNDTACAGHDETLTTVDDTVDVLECDLAIGSDGFPVISYYDATNTALRVVKCNDAACLPPGETKTTVDNTAAVGRYSSIAIGTDGFPAVSYEGEGTLKMVKCNDLACSGAGETIAIVDDPPTTPVGRYTSIAIGSDGLPVISYYDRDLGDLKIAKCAVATCDTLGTRITTIHEAGDVGLYSSIAIAADGLPLVAYSDSSADSLTVAKCNDSACSGLNETFSTLDDDATDTVGLFASLAIGADGLPVVSYHTHGTASVLKVVKCQTRSCFAP